MSASATGIAAVAAHPVRRFPLDRLVRLLPPVLVLALGLSACAAPHARVAQAARAPATNTPIRQLSPEQIASLEALSGSELAARLGRPDFQRRDPPAELWQYRSSACVLNVFLYPQPDGALKVSYARAQDPRESHGPVNGCSPFPPSQVAALSPGVGVSTPSLR